VKIPGRFATAAAVVLALGCGNGDARRAESAAKRAAIEAEEARAREEANARRAFIKIFAKTAALSGPTGLAFRAGRRPLRRDEPHQSGTALQRVHGRVQACVPQRRSPSCDEKPMKVS
jgi:hypothetical protein